MPPNFDRLAATILDLGPKARALESADAVVTDRKDLLAEMQKQRELVEPVAGPLGAIIIAGGTIDSSFDWIDSSFQKLEELINAPQLDHKAVGQVVESIKKSRSSLNTIRDELKAWWKDQCERVRSVIPSESDLAAIGSIDSDCVAKLRTIASTLQQRQEALPSTLQQIHELESLREQSIMLWSDLDLPDAVKAFLGGVMRGVPLSKLSDEVMNWLREHDRLDSFVVRQATHRFI